MDDAAADAALVQRLDRLLQTCRERHADLLPEMVQLQQAVLRMMQRCYEVEQRAGNELLERAEPPDLRIRDLRY